MAIDPRIEAILEVVRKLASGDQDARAELTGKYDELDALAMGINMLAEEIGASMVSRDEYKSKLTELGEAMERVKTLSGLLPVCAWCKQVRDDDGYWTELERYVVKHSDAQLTHGMCPSCAETMTKRLE